MLIVMTQTQLRSLKKYLMPTKYLVIRKNGLLMTGLAIVLLIPPVTADLVLMILAVQGLEICLI